jgi:polyvinyl alcohol dehydrogenase (cytochrome)
MRNNRRTRGGRSPARGAGWRILPVIAAIAAFLCVGVRTAAATSLDSWPSASQSVLGERTQPLEFTINPQNVSHLKPKWVFTMNGSQGESATPTVADGVVYFPDWNGYLYAVNAQTGGLIWQQKISSYDGQPGQVSRNSPLIVGNELILGDNANSAQPGGAHVFAVSRADGRLLWSTEVDTNPAAIITSNAVAVGNEVVVGISSNEEADAEVASYGCCSFRGAVVALNALTGKMMWKTYMVPSNNPAGGDSNIPCASPNGPHGCGYTGGGVWGTPTVDPVTNQVFVGTGNNYTTPDSAEACATADQNASPPVDDANCTPPNDYFDAVVALNLLTGQIEWGHKVQGYDAWNVACLIGEQPGATWCPAPGSPDFDFGGSSPNLFIGKGSNGQLTTLVGDGQKSGIYWAFDPSNGKIVWDTLVGPGSSLGGVEWGSAYDGLRIYTTEANPDLGGPPTTYTLCCGGGIASGGSWAALNPLTGAFDWQTPVPGNYAAVGPVSEANGVMYGESMVGDGSQPDMFALDAATGKILWSYNAGSSVISGPSIVDGTVYWGAGYTHLGLPLFTGNNKFYAFSLNGK